MRIYVRKMFPHDITHEVSVRTDIVNDFFNNKTRGMIFVGKKSGFEGEVIINSTTDPRFGGEFKALLTDEGRADVNDILLIYKLGGDRYKLEIVKPKDERFFDLMVLFRGKNRHAFLETEEELKLAGL